MSTATKDPPVAVRGTSREYNFDGLVGPTHNYGGLSPGNTASMRHEGALSNPRAAALQGLAKMRFVRGLGVGQCVLPPHPRPDLATLRALGFTGSDESLLTAVTPEREHLVRLCSSAAAMWTANAGTVAPSSDTADGRLHVTPANLQAMFHRAIEAPVTTSVLRRIFADGTRFVVHDPLPGGGQFADEGAANHLRLVGAGGQGVHLFAWGRRAWGDDVAAPRRFPARQTFEASEALARLHGLAPDRVIFAQQDPAGIDAGAFHTDVLAVANEGFVMLHERAFVDRDAVLAALRRMAGDALRVETATELELPLTDAVAAYPFNSQVVTLPDGSMAILAPDDARENRNAHAFLQRVLEGKGRVSAVHYLDVLQSMHNGGGPACLRLRVALRADEVAALGARVVFDDALDRELVAWVGGHYRDRLMPADLCDPALARESMTALDDLTRILHLGSVYGFQR